MRGENPYRAGITPGYVGSSPHARGKPEEAAINGDGVGLIPACAGKTLQPLQAVPALGAHPRMRGENAGHGTSRVCPPGSSPHARGKPWLSIYPARYRGAHPRMRGENTNGSESMEFARGSSPHARGKLPHFDDSIDCTGLIPACAGKTFFQTS